MDPAQIASFLNVSTIVVIMLSMGLKADFKDVLATVRQSRLLFTSVLANYILVPIVSVVLLRLFKADPIVSVGILILAVCPGAPVSPPLTAIAKGDLPAAIGIMVLLACLSAVVTPVLLHWMLAQFSQNQDFHIDSLAILRTLLLVQLSPLGLGLLVQRLEPKFAGRAARPMARLGNALLVTLLCMILYHQFPTLAAIRWSAWGEMALLLASSLIIGWLAGYASRELRIAMALNTAVRNIAVGLIIVSGNFAGTPAVTAVLAYGLVSMLGAAAFAAVVRQMKPKSTVLIGAQEFG